MSLITAKNPSTVSSYLPTMGKKVSPNEVTLNDKALEIKEKMLLSYKRLNQLFKNLATEYRNCANRSVRGTDLVEGLKKVASNCEKQGEYCLKRGRNLDGWCSYKSQKQEVQAMADAIQKLENAMTSQSSYISSSGSVDTNMYTK